VGEPLLNLKADSETPPLKKEIRCPNEDTYIPIPQTPKKVEQGPYGNSLRTKQSTVTIKK